MRIIQTGACLVLLMAGIPYAPANEVPIRKGSDANVTGHVIDRQSGEHLAYATVAVEGTTIATSTDATGHFFLKNLPAGRFALSASSVGYQTGTEEVEFTAGHTLEINFSLAERAINVDEVVVSASRTATNRKNAPTLVSIVPSELFVSTASCSLADAMSLRPGLRVENDCSNCGSTQLRINGLEGHYTQVLLDSRPIFSSLASVYGLEQLPAAMIERVEVIRGGGSALYGANAIGGVVNVITREPLRNTFELGHITQLIDGKTPDFHTTFNGAVVSDDARLGAYLFGMARQRDPYDRNGDDFSDVPKLRSEVGGFRAYYKTSPYSRLVAEYHHIHEFRRGGNAFERPAHRADIAEQLDHRIDGGGLSFDLSTPDRRHRLGLYASGQRIGRESYYGTEQNPDAYGSTSDATLVGGAQYTYAFRRLWFLPADLTLGAEFQYNALHDRYLGFGRDLRQTTRSAGLYLQNEWKSERLNLLVGARIDRHNKVRKVVFSPRVNVRYTPVAGVGLRASYSGGYRPPQAYNEDLHIDALDNKMVLIELAPDLRPEYAYSLSGSVDLYRRLGRIETSLLIEGFRTKLDDVFTLEKTGENADGYIIKERRNASGATIAGMTVEARIARAGRFEVQAGYTFQSSRYDEPERWSGQVEPQRRMFRSPDHYGYLTASVNLAAAWGLTLFGTFTGPMLVQHNTGAVPRDSERTTPTYGDAGGRLSYTIRLKGALQMELHAGVKNVLDHFQNDLDSGVHKDAAYVYGPALPRTFFFGIRFML